MATYLLFSLWGLCIVCALLGYGRPIMRLLGCGPGLSWLMAPVPGLACLVLSGGALDLLGIISRPIVVASVVLGIILFLVGAIQDRKLLARVPALVRTFTPPGPLSWLGAILIVGMLALRLGGSVLTNPALFERHDDFQAYLAFPMKMLQTGSFAADPFSERRVRVLGGNTYLQAVLVAPFSDLRITHLLDGTIGLFLLLVFGVVFCRQLRLSVRASLAVLFVLAMTPAFAVNVTSVILPGALLLFLALVHLDDAWSQRLSLRKALLMGLAAGTACTLKPTILPAFAVMIAAMALLDLQQLPLRKVLRAGAVIAAGASLVLLPWMIDSALKNGTALYPLLGHGYHSSSYAYPVLAGYPALKDWLLKWPSLESLVFFLAALALFKMRGLPADGRKQTALAALIAAGTVLLLFQYLATGVSPRFSMSTVWPVNVMVLAILLAPTPADKDVAKPLRSFAYLYALFAVLIVFTAIGITGESALYYARIVKINLLVKSDATPTRSLLAQDRAIQQAIPAGAALLARTDESFGFDFTRNPILIADYPGSASLPPGMPLDGNPDSLKRYLLQHSIRYAAYSYYDHSRFPTSLCQKRTSYAFWEENPIEAREATAACIVQDDLAKLGSTQKRLYDDGEIYVLDLAQSLR